jgi:general stress protein YciG
VFAFPIFSSIPKSSEPLRNKLNLSKNRRNAEKLRSFYIRLGNTTELYMANEQRGGSANFANDPERASEAGKKGGEHSHGGQHGQEGGSPKQQGGSSPGQQGGAGNFANDREKASEAGRKGGQS